MNEENKYNFTYSAREQSEVKRIREKYIKKEESAMERLRRLDASVTKKATVWSLIVGIVSTLILGVGMCCCLEWSDTMFLPGVVIGAAGIVGVSLAYPIYKRITEKEREKIAPEILRLTDELMK